MKRGEGCSIAGRGRGVSKFRSFFPRAHFSGVEAFSFFLFSNSEIELVLFIIVQICEEDYVAFEAERQMKDLEKRKMEEHATKLPSPKTDHSNLHFHLEEDIQEEQEGELPSRSSKIPFPTCHASRTFPEQALHISSSNFNSSQASSSAQGMP